MSTDWRSWRLPAGSLTWRAALPEDQPAIEALWVGMEKRLGAQDRPNLYAWPVMLTLVGCDGGGVVRDALYVEAVATVTKIGLDPIEELPRIVDSIHGFLWSKEVRACIVTIPLKLRRLMRDGFERAGLTCADKKLSHFVRRIRT